MFESTADFISLLKWRMRNDYDNVLVVDGYEGTGKSTLALRIANRLTPKFDASTNVIFDWTDWNKTFDPAKTRQVFNMDEGMNLLFNRDFNRGENKAFIQLLAQMRQLQNTVIICVPNFFTLDKYVREHRVQWRLICDRRGHAVLHKRHNNLETGQEWFEHSGLELEYGPLRGTVWNDYVQKKRVSLHLAHPSLAERWRMAKAAAGAPEDLTPRP